MLLGLGGVAVFCIGMVAGVGLDQPTPTQSLLSAALAAALIVWMSKLVVP